MKNELTKSVRKDERHNIKVSKEIIQKAAKMVFDLNQADELLPKDPKNSLLKRQKKMDVLIDLNRKRTLKSFTEAALLYFVENKIDQRCTMM